MNVYSKQPLSIEDQIVRLRSNGLIIADEDRARKVLREISYFRLAAYLRPMEADKQQHLFKPGSTFENAVNLYEFDNELRQLLFSAIGRIEVALRSKIIQYFSMRHGAFWFMQMSLHDNEHRFLENLNSLDREVTRSKIISANMTSQSSRLHGRLWNCHHLVRCLSCITTFLTRRQRN